MTVAVEAREVVYSFGVTPALRSADLAVAEGEILAIMGPSGSGKSTLLHCLAGVLVPDSGEVRFGGARIDSLSEERHSELRRSSFGFVFQYGVVACADIPAAYGRCAPGVAVAAVEPGLNPFRESASAARIWPAADVPPAVVAQRERDHPGQSGTGRVRPRGVGDRRADRAAAPVQPAAAERRAGADAAAAGRFGERGADADEPPAASSST